MWRYLGFLVSLSLFLSKPLYANTSLEQNYLQRFQNYLAWSQNLPNSPSPAFIAFIEGKGPLSRRLRERWLYKLYQQHQWEVYQRYYQTSQDDNLRCFYAMTYEKTGQHSKAMQLAAPIWLSPHSLSPGCNQLTNLLTHDASFSAALIDKRLALALENRNIGLAYYLLTLYKPAKLTEKKRLLDVHQRPERVAYLGRGSVYGQIVLYGLKRLASRNMPKAIQLFRQNPIRSTMSLPEQQAFIGYVSLYKAMRNESDTVFWFGQLQPRFYSDPVLEWQIRYALKRQSWGRVAHLIPFLKDKNNACWQYWLARAFEAQGQTDKARALYAKLANQRQYYGFLASNRLKRMPAFHLEAPIYQASLIKTYAPILNQVRNLYFTHRKSDASKMLTDFISELPRTQKATVLQWTSKELQWHDKALALSNTDELSNQLHLRFPVLYERVINTLSKQYHVPKPFIYAIIRQESLFREDVVSSVGARGLMQIMPATAKHISRTSRIPYRHQDELFHWHRNIPLGVAYLSQLSKRFTAHPILVAAAYNAGPRQANNWVRNQPRASMDIWVETLPWPETRNYIKNVIAFYAVYQYRLKERVDMTKLMRTI